MHDETVRACPECDSTAVRPRSPGKPSRSPTGTSGEWYCRDCRKAVDEPIKREKRATGNRSGTAKELVDIDVSEVPALGGDDGAE